MRLSTRRLLTAVKSGLVLGPELETRLLDAGVKSGFLEALSMRSETKSLAANPVAITAIVASPIATDSVFGAASINNSTAAQAMAASPVAMLNVTLNLPTLTKIINNQVAWNIYLQSPYAVDNIGYAAAVFAGLNLITYPDRTFVFADTVAMAQIIASTNAIRSVIEDDDLVLRTSVNSIGMELVATNATALSYITNSQRGMSACANSAIAMFELSSKSLAIVAISNSKIAVDTIYANSVARASYKASAFFVANLKNTIANLAGINPLSFPTIDDIINNNIALTAVNANEGASEALSSSSAAMLTLGTSANLSIVTGNTVIMAALASNNTAMVNIATSTNFALVKGNAVIMTALAGNSAGVTALSTHANLTLAINDPIGMAKLSANSISVGILVGATSTVGVRDIIFNSETAMVSVSNNTVSINAINANATRWTEFKESPYYEDNAFAITYNLAGITLIMSTFTQMIAKASALTLVNANAGASEVLATNSDAMLTLATSANFGIVVGNSLIMTGFVTNAAALTALGGHSNINVAIGNAVAIGLIVNSAPAMASYVANNTILASLFASSVAKTAIFTSTVTVAALAASASAVTYLKSIQTLLLSSTTPTAGNWVSFGTGVPAKILMVTYRQQGIGAIETPIRFRSPEGPQLSMVGTAAIGDQIGRTHIGAYSNLEFNTTAISAITGSGIGYISML
jgi:predicted ribosome-associated RNA-binding protein Tma20